MENPLIYDPKLHGDSAKVENYRFNHIALNDALAFSRANDARFKSMPMDKMAEVIGLSRTNFQRLKKGEVPDPRSSTIWLICSTLHIAPHILLGLPAPVSEKEAESPSATAPWELHMRDIERRNEAQERELERLRKMLLAEGKEASAAKEQARSLEKNLAATKEENVLLRRRSVMLLIIIAVLLLLVAFCISEITNPYDGLTSMFM